MQQGMGPGRRWVTRSRGRIRLISQRAQAAEQQKQSHKEWGSYSRVVVHFDESRQLESLAPREWASANPWRAS